MVGGVGGPPGGGRIGGPHSPGAPGAPTPSARPTPADAVPFAEHLARAESVAEGARASGASGVSGAAPLDRLRSGEITSAQYAHLRVEEATRHLEELLSSADLDGVRDALADAIEHDPEIAALVRAAETGT